MQASAFEKSVTGFAYSASGIATLLLIPLIIRLCKGNIATYLSHEFPPNIAQWGAWVFIVLTVILAFFFINMMLQLGVRMMLCVSARRGGF